MKTFLQTFLTILGLSVINLAQAQMTTVWSNSAGSANADASNACVINEAGEVYSAGDFSSTITFSNNSTLTSSGAKDVFLTKFKADGTISWAKKISSSGEDHCSDLKMDDNGNLVIVGDFSGNLDFGNGVTLTNAGSSDAFVAQLDSDGNANWALSAGGSGDDKASSVEVDGQGNIYVSGHFNSMDGNFGANPMITIGENDAFVAKITSNGTISWMNSLGTTNNEMFNDLAVNSSGKLLVTGSFDNLLILGDDTLNTSAGSKVVVQYSAEGSLDWGNQEAGSSDMEDGKIEVDKDDNIYTSGMFEGTITIDGKEYISAGGTDAIIIKHNSEGQVTWVQTMGGSGNDRCSDLDITNDGWVIAGGSFEGMSSFGADNLTSAGGSDNFIASLNGNGEVESAISSGGEMNEKLHGVSANSSNQVVATGSFEGNSSFKRGEENSEGNSDMYVWKVEDQSTGIDAETMEQLSVYPSPVENKLFINVNLDNRINYNIFDLNGRILESGVLNNSTSNELDVDELEPGLYFIQLKNNNDLYRAQFIKN